MRVINTSLLQQAREADETLWIEYLTSVDCEDRQWLKYQRYLALRLIKCEVKLSYYKIATCFIPIISLISIAFVINYYRGLQ